MTEKQNLPEKRYSYESLSQEEKDDMRDYRIGLIERLGIETKENDYLFMVEVENPPGETSTYDFSHTKKIYGVLNGEEFQFLAEQELSGEIWENSNFHFELDGKVHPIGQDHPRLKHSISGKSLIPNEERGIYSPKDLNVWDTNLNKQEKFEAYRNLLIILEDVALEEEEFDLNESTYSSRDLEEEAEIMFNDYNNQK